ncbi:hypothetical protein DPMN_052132 [Dreissena polymorpha]|uniref:Uncharacterized protein n=1 Tax=Dreissena polymorpha TaxID=45954 RepID=A0A9D4CJ50_DREPO|nr:hypothetical protein DPMN_052132 [Dreissena polymorpha]
MHHLAVNRTSLTLLPQAIDTYPVFNEQTAFMRITSPSRPAAGFEWFIADRKITDMASYTYSSEVATRILRYTPV